MLLYICEKTNTSNLASCTNLSLNLHFEFQMISFYFTLSSRICNIHKNHSNKNLFHTLFNALSAKFFQFQRWVDRHFFSSHFRIKLISARSLIGKNIRNFCHEVQHSRWLDIRTPEHHSSSSKVFSKLEKPNECP